MLWCVCAWEEIQREREWERRREGGREKGGWSGGQRVEIVIWENLRVIGSAKCIMIIRLTEFRVHLSLVAMIKVSVGVSVFFFHHC